MDKKKILIVDDEPDFVTMLKARLEANNYEIITASNGEEGLEMAEKENPRLILLDILMPKKDGYTMLTELKVKDGIKSTPVIVLTAKSAMRDLFKIEGINDYLIKPFENEELLLKIKNAIGE